jgi:hypothetical protein
MYAGSGESLMSGSRGRSTDPDAVEADHHHAGALNVVCSIPENGGRVLRVVYVMDGQVVRIITAFFDRRVKP